MSGIAGIIHFDGKSVDPGLIQKMTSAMAHRGPDGINHWTKGSVALGQCTLHATRYSATEALPHTDTSRQLTIVADARIDNRQELIRALKLQSLESAVLSDSKLILQAYRKWRVNCPKYLLGDFAFAIWDSRQQTLFCARDHFGIKPFYYSLDQHSFHFASEIGALLAVGARTPQLSESALGDFFLFGYNRDSASTYYQDVNCLSPAHTLEIKNGHKAASVYWTLSTKGQIRYRRVDDYIHDFRELLATAVNDRVYPDATGVLLSGGMDSSAVAAMATKGRTEGAPDPHLKAYTFTAHDTFPTDQEGYFAGQIAAHLGCPIHYHAIDHCPLFDRWDQPFFHPQEPTYYPFSAGRLDLFKQMHQDGVRVVLSGEGGDPILLTDPTYFIDLFKHRLWGDFFRETMGYLQVHRSLRGLGLRRFFQRNPTKPWAPAFPEWLQPDFVQRHQLRERWSEHYRQSLPCPSPARRDALLLELGAESVSYWSKSFEEDRSTKLALDFRYPFFDLRLIQLALSIPAFLICKKTILRRAVASFLPSIIWQRPKTPFQGDLVRYWFMKEKNSPKTYADSLAPILGLVNQHRYKSALHQYANNNCANIAAWDSILLLTPVSFNRWVKTSTFTITR